MKISETFAGTNETIVRDMTEDELAQREKDIEQQVQLKAKQEEAEAAKAEAKAALLDRLGITAEEAKLLLS